jgi:hypothetical protein
MELQCWGYFSSQGQSRALLFLRVARNRQQPGPNGPEAVHRETARAFRVLVLLGFWFWELGLGLGLMRPQNAVCARGGARKKERKVTHICAAHPTKVLTYFFCLFVFCSIFVFLRVLLGVLGKGRSKTPQKIQSISSTPLVFFPLLLYYVAVEPAGMRSTWKKLGDLFVAIFFNCVFGRSR